MMLKRHLRYAGLVAASLGMLAGNAPSAYADNLFDRLFGGSLRIERPRVEQRQRSQPRRQETQQRKAVRQQQARKPAPKVSAPSYYTYRPQGLVNVAFAAIEQKKPESNAVSRPESTTFGTALAGLDGFELPAEKEIAAALVEYYTANPEFIWVSGDRPGKRAEEALRVLAGAGAFGLSEADYAVAKPSFISKRDADQQLHSMIRFEMALSARALRYARDAHGGRVNPNKLSGYHDFKTKPLDLVQTLKFMANASKVGTYLEGLHPQNDAYKALRKELAALQSAREKDIVVDPKMFVRPGGKHPDFTSLLQIIKRDADSGFLAEYGDSLENDPASETYTSDLVPLIKAAQQVHGLLPDGVIGPRTVAAIAGETKAARIEKTLLALERLRWHPSDLGETRVMLNVASYEARFIDRGEVRLSMRTVVGKKANQTSFFHDEIDYVEFNPYWGVPRSILVNEMLPRLLRDPGYLDRAGYEVVNSRGKQVSSASVNWGQYGDRIPYTVRQKPGPRNSLGELKIMFPNKHLIYMHDTPAKSLFKRDTRAFSHGCVRLENPRAMAAAVLDMPEATIDDRVENGRSTKKVPRKIPVYVAYFTAWPDETGKIAYHGDVYERDKYLGIALEKVSETRAASI